MTVSGAFQAIQIFTLYDWVGLKITVPPPAHKGLLTVLFGSRYWDVRGPL